MRFRNAALIAVDAIYNFAGGLKAPAEVSLAPTQFVHDVAPDAARATSIIAMDQVTSTTGGAGAAAFTSRSRADWFTAFADELASVGRTIPNTDIFLLGISAHVTAGTEANFQRCAVGALFPSDGRLIAGDAPVDGQAVFFANDTIANSGVRAGGGIMLAFQDGLGVFHGPREIAAISPPVRVIEMQYRAQDNTVGATEVIFQTTLLFAPQATRQTL